MPPAVITRVAVLAALASCAWALVPTQSFASTLNLVHNASFESFDRTTGTPSCWVTSALGRNTGSVSRTTHAHNGSHAARLQITAFHTGGRLIGTRRIAACDLPAQRTTLAYWQHSTSGLRTAVSYRLASGWTAWKSVARVGSTSSWRHSSVTLPTPPAGSRAMAVGFEITARGTATVDGVTASAVTATGANKPPAPQPSPTPSSTPGTALWSPVTPATGLVTNEYAYWNPTLATSVRSADWEMTSGSLFSTGTALWTGVPDTANPNATSSNGTDSAVFRLTSKRADFGNVAVGFTLHNNGLTSTSSTPPVDWDGVHIFLRYQSEYQLYYASVNRRDGHVVIKKKCAGGVSNNGTYYELGPGEVSGHPIPFGSNQPVGASVVDNADGSVTLTLSVGGTKLVTAVDTGVGCAPITAPGKVGIRGDNDNFTVTGFTVTAA